MPLEWHLGHNFKVIDRWAEIQEFSLTPLRSDNDIPFDSEYRPRQNPGTRQLNMVDNMFCIAEKYT